MNTLVTGGRGFVGTNLIRALEGNSSSYDLLDGHDLLDINKLIEKTKNIDCIIHLGALIDVADSMKNPARTIDVNIKGTAGVVEAARFNDVKKIVFASSAAVYGNEPTIPKTEKSQVCPDSIYGISKVAGENLMAMANQVYGIKTCSLRIFNMYGPRQKIGGGYAAAIPKFIGQALKGEKITIYNDGLQTRDFIYVDDAVEAIKLAVNYGSGSGVFNIASGRPTSIIELAETINAICNGSGYAFVKGPEGEVKFSAADISKAKERLGFVPRVSLDYGLKMTVDWFRKL